MVNTIIILSVLLLVSLVLNGFMIWYARTTSSSLLFVSENLSFLKEAIQAYANHLEAIYGLEMFYGDETLKFLIDHTRALLEQVSEFENVIALTENEEIIIDDREVEVASNTSPEEEAQKKAALQGPHEKHVLYGGTRRGNN